MDSTYRAVLDMDSTEIPVYGEQEQSAYNGHFESTCYHLQRRNPNWSLTSLQPVSRRAGEDGRSAGPALRDARYYWLLLAEGVA